MDPADPNETSSLSSFVQEFETFAEEVKDGIPEVDFRGRINNRERSKSEDIGMSLTNTSQLSLRSDKQVSFIKALLSPRTPYEEFHRLFKQVPKDQFPINDFSCALSREILLQGRIYISQGWFCFYSNIFGWETQVTIDCSKVQSITREKTAYVVPNAILITTEDEKHFFSSFLSRETVFKLLVEVWEEVLRKKGRISPLDEILDKKISLDDDTALFDCLEEAEECTVSNSELTLEGSVEVASKFSGDSGIYDCQSGSVTAERPSDGAGTPDKDYRTLDTLLPGQLNTTSTRQPACDPASVAVFVASFAEMLYSYCQVSIRLMKRLSREQLFFLVTTFLIMFLMSCSAFLLYRLSILEPKILTPPLPPSKAFLQKSVQQILQLRKQVHEAEVSRVRSIVTANLDAITQIRETLEMLQDDLTNHMSQNCTLLTNNKTVCIRV